MKYNNDEIQAGRYIKFLFLFGRRLIEIRDFIWDRFALHLKHELDIVVERKFAVSGEIALRIFTEHEMNY